MSGAIAFSQIPANQRTPLFYAEFDSTRAGPSTNQKRLLLVADTLVNAPFVPVLLPSAAWAENTYGTKSRLARMARKLEDAGLLRNVWAVPVAPITGTVASWTLTPAGTVTTGGTIPLRVAGQLIQVPAPTGATAGTIANNFVNAINAATAAPIVITSNVQGVVTVLSAQSGEISNQTDIRVGYFGAAGGEVMPGGLSVAVAVTQPASGTPDLSALADTIAGLQFDYIATPFADAASRAVCKAMMAKRWGYLSPTYGAVFTAKCDSFQNLSGLAANQNDPYMVLMGYPQGCPSPPWEVSAILAGVAAQALNADQARPLQTLALPGFMGPAPGTIGFTPDQVETLLNNGIAQAAFNADGTAQILRAVTTYQTNRYGQADQAYLDIETAYTLAEITRRLDSITTTKFPRHKLVDDGTPIGPGQAFVTPKSYKAEIYAAYVQMMRDGLVEDADQMMANTIVQRNAADSSRLDVLWAPFLVGGLRIVALLNQFRQYSAEAAGETSASFAAA